MSNWRIPLSDLDYTEKEEEAVLQVLRRKWLSMGEEVQAFEHEFADLLNVPHAYAVANGTAALHLGLAALGIGPGDEIIQPALNFVATANMTVSVGAVPVFADIVSLSEPTIDPNEIEKRITPRTKAVVVMHYGGYACRMTEIAALCQHYRLALVEDACHAVGARFYDLKNSVLSGRAIGSLGDVGCFSFFSNKNLATGEGGMIVTNKPELAEKVRLLRSHGMSTLTWDRHKGHASSYEVIEHGFNYRLDEIRAALGRVQLRKLLNNNQKRATLVQVYSKGLENLTGWQIPFADYVGDSAYHLMTLLAPTPGKRQIVVDALKRAGIQTSLHYPCITDFRAFADYNQVGQLSLSQAYAERVITLPLFPTLTEEQVEEVCDIVRQHSGEEC